MTDAEITTTILRQIRDEIIATRSELKAEIVATRSELRSTRIEVKAEIGQTNERLDVTNDRLSIVEHSVRDLAVQMLTLTRYVKNTNDDLKKRVTRIEKKSG